MAHLALNAGGLCDLHEDREPKELEDRIELYCNRVAAAALIPLEVLVHIREFGLAKSDKRWTPEQLETLAAPFGTSAESMLLRLIRLGKATWDLYWALKPGFEEAYAAATAKQKESDSGPSFYTVKARDLGPGYVRTVLDAFRGRTISSLDAADYLDVRFEQIPKLEQAAR
jgi:Zn-dependent peptidase ImmA (M78 family)